MKDTDRKWIAWAITVILIVLGTLIGVKFPIPDPPLPLGYSHFSGLHVAAPTTQPTTTPAAIISSEGLGTLLEVQDAGTRVIWIEDGGALQAVSGIQIAAPTAQATATPAVIINSLGLSNLIEVRDAATPVFWVEDGGAVRGTYWTVSFEAADTALTSTQDPVYTFQMPFAATLIEASAACRDIDVADTDETYVLSLEDDGVAITSAWAVVADNTIDASTITTATVADNSVLETVLTLGGTTPSAEDCYVTLTFQVK